MVTHLFWVVKKDLAFSLISSIVSLPLPPKAGNSLVIVSIVPTPLIELLEPALVKSPEGTFEDIPPPTLYFTVRDVWFGASPNESYELPAVGSIEDGKSLVCPGITIPACSKFKNSSPIDEPCFKIPLPNTNDVELSSFVSIINLLLVWIYANEYGIGNSSISVPASWPTL